jgi:hypothetical protein
MSDHALTPARIAAHYAAGTGHSSVGERVAAIAEQKQRAGRHRARRAGRESSSTSGARSFDRSPHAVFVLRTFHRIAESVVFVPTVTGSAHRVPMNACPLTATESR